jgi:lysozyme
MAHAYRDTGGILTIGYGTRIFTQADAVKYANGITEEQGMQLMQASLVKECRSLSQLPLNGFFQYQQDALISLAYNIGYEAFVNSSIYTRLIHRATDLSPWLWYIRDAKKVPQDGLQMRREKELKLFIYGIY